MAKNALKEYSAKRTFAATPEPPPALPAAGGGPLLFVVQQHSATRLHYDFRLECDGVLLSWAVPKGPSLDRNEKRLAVHVEDHPYDYGSFEGVIPAGQYGAGEVIVWDCGVYSPDEGGVTFFHDRAQAEREVRDGLENGKLSILLRGEKLKGSFALVRTKEKNQWLMIKHKDRFVTTTDVTQQNHSVLSGKTVTELKFLPVRRIPAAQTRAGGQGRGDAHEDEPDARRGWRRAVPPRRVDVGTQARRISRARIYRRARRQAALAARPRAFVQIPAPGGGTRATVGERDDPRRRARRVRRERQAVIRGVAGSRRAEDGTRDRRGRQVVARGLLLLRPAPFRGHRSAQVAVFRSPALPCAMPAAVAAGATGARARGRRCAQRRGARQWLRRRGRQAQAKPLRGRSPFAIVVEGQADAERGFRRRRLHPREGGARAAGRHPGRLLGWRSTQGKAALRVARRLGLRRARAEAGQGPAGTVATQDLPLRRDAGPQWPDDLGGAGNGRRSELSELDRGRSPARAGLPAPSRRHRSIVRATCRSRPCGGGFVRRPDRRRREPAREHQDGVHAGGGRAPHPSHPASIASTGRPIRRKTFPRSPSAIC